MKPQNFAGLRVVAFESRRAEEMHKLIENQKGIATVAPSMREVPLEENQEAMAFEKALLAGELDLVIVLTGVGVRMLTREIETRLPREAWTAALRQVPIVARGPKPVGALKELDVPVTLRVDEPNTWRELLAALDEHKDTLPVRGKRVAVQEYGMMNRQLMKGLKARGAQVMRVPVYRWALPKDTGPLREAIEGIVEGRFDVALFTTGTQVWHLFKLAAKKGLEEEVRQGLRRMVVASIGPTTSESLTEFDVQTDLTPEHPKMGHLVKHAALHSHGVLEAKGVVV